MEYTVPGLYDPVDTEVTVNMDGYRSYTTARSTHECMVCGDTIDLSAQVCSRFCMRTLEQLDYMHDLEAQIESPLSITRTSDYEFTSTLAGPYKVVPVPSSPVLPPLSTVAHVEEEVEHYILQHHKSFESEQDVN